MDFIPQLLGDIISLWLYNSLPCLVTYALDSRMSTMNEMKSYSQAVIEFFMSMLIYSIVLVSNLVAVNNYGFAWIPSSLPSICFLDRLLYMLQKEGNIS